MNKRKGQKGTIRVARWNPGWKVPKIEGYTNIFVLTATTRLSKGDGENIWQLGPYHLADSKGRILENLWQFSKVYKEIPCVSIPYSSRSNQIVWKREATIFLDNKQDILKEDYFKWRKEGQENKYPVRNPVGWKALKTCIGSICEQDLSLFQKQEKQESLQSEKESLQSEKESLQSHKESLQSHKESLELPLTIKQGKEKGLILDYITARFKIYLAYYSEFARKKKEFYSLKERLETGENLLIIEQDGPHIEGNYTQFCIDKNTNSVIADKETLSILILDERYPFGHGYCLACLLLDIELL